MMKEVALFAISSSVLIYFLSPVSEEPATVPEEILQKVEPVKPQAPRVEDSWGYEDADDYEDEEFVFGEPMVSDEDDDYEDQADQSNNELGELIASTNKPSTQAATTKSAKSGSSHPDSPKGSQRGSKNNPIVFETNNPEDPVED